MSTTNGLRFTHAREILEGIPDKPDNSVVYFIGYHIPEDIIGRADYYTSKLMPPQRAWMDYVHAGDKKSPYAGWHHHGVRPKQQERLSSNDQAYSMCQHIKARAKVRPVYIGCFQKRKDRSPAKVAIDFIEGYVTLPKQEDER